MNSKEAVIDEIMETTKIKERIRSDIVKNKMRRRKAYTRLNIIIAHEKIQEMIDAKVLCTDIRKVLQSEEWDKMINDTVNNHIYEREKAK